MFPTLNNFHLLSTTEESETFLFARLFDGELQLIYGEKAYRSTLHDCSIHGAIGPVTSEFLCFLLTNPLTEALLTVKSNNSAILELHLMDAQSVTLCLTATLTKTLAVPLLHRLIMSLLAGLSGLEHLLLSVGNKIIPDHDFTSNMSLEKLSVFCAPLVHEGKQVVDIPSFRKGVSNNMSVIATRALVIASQAAQVREEVVARQRARATEERDRRAEVGRMLQETKQRAKENREKKATVSLFDDTSPASKEDKTDSLSYSLRTKTEDLAKNEKQIKRTDSKILPQEHESDQNKEISLKRTINRKSRDNKPSEVVTCSENSQDLGTSSQLIDMSIAPTARPASQPKKKKRKVARIV